MHAGVELKCHEGIQEVVDQYDLDAATHISDSAPTTDDPDHVDDDELMAWCLNGEWTAWKHVEEYGFWARFKFEPTGMQIMKQSVDDPHLQS